jgi:hypothetical protein
VSFTDTCQASWVAIIHVGETILMTAVTGRCMGIVGIDKVDFFVWRKVLSMSMKSIGGPHRGGLLSRCMLVVGIFLWLRVLGVVKTA